MSRTSWGAEVVKAGGEAHDLDLDVANLGIHTQAAEEVEVGRASTGRILTPERRKFLVSDDESRGRGRRISHSGGK